MGSANQASDRHPGPRWESPLSDLPGLGPERSDQLARLGLHTVGDLLQHRPRRHEDRRRILPIARIELGESAAVRGRISALGVKRFRHGSKSLFEIILEDGTGRLHLRWWNAAYMKDHFAAGEELLVYGRLTDLRPRTMDHPETERLEPEPGESIHLNRIVPVYPLTEGITQRWLRTLVWRTLDDARLAIPEPWPSNLLPNRPSRADAFRQLHFPAELADAIQARERLALDELIDLQCRLLERRQRLEARAQAIPCAGDNRWIKPWLAQLGFRLTQAQTRVLREIRADLAGPCPMRRLLQGDVGSGKTVVAAAAALMTLESGHDAALMAPTEILAEQHAATFERWFDPLGIRVELRTASHKSAPPDSTPAPPELPRLLPPRDTPEVRLVVGTHALIESSFDMPRLGLVIIDEQHRFGVAQREKLVRKGHYPHLLVMTATPIPRTLGLTLYGDLDLSAIDELPAGRGRVRTFVRSADRLPRVWAFVRDQLQKGRQAYIVYPLIDESECLDLKAVTREWDSLRQTLDPFRVGLLHGRLPPLEKERTLDAFRRRELHALLSTPVIEVGLDIPNATVMLVENAERFGLAQLHQLRGRIGRGADDAFCILISAGRSPDARRRLEVLAQTTDGFRIAAADLELRGPGQLLGQRQSGLPAFQFADLARDLPLINLARHISRQILDSKKTGPAHPSSPP